MKRSRLAAGVLVVLALTACGKGTGGTGASTLGDTPSAASPSGSGPAEAPPSGPGPAGASPSGSGPAGPSIPAAALLQAADFDGVAPEVAGGNLATYLRPPRPCGDPLPSDSARLASTAVSAAPYPDRDGNPRVVLETIVRYRAGAGTQAASELTAALRRCPGELGWHKRRWEILGDLPAGDQAILVRTTTQVAYGEPGLVTVSTPVAVARVGDHLVLVADLGWETTGGDEAVVRRLIVTAVERLRAAT